MIASLALRSIGAARRGDFDLLIERLRSDAELSNVERLFLAHLLSGDEPGFSIEQDKRVGKFPNLPRRLAMAKYVHTLISAGEALPEALAAADHEFRDGSNQRIATVRSAYREFFPAEYERVKRPRKPKLDPSAQIGRPKKSRR
jgi:hypothetical protein